LEAGELLEGGIRHEDRCLLAEAVLPNAVLVGEEGTPVYGQGESFLAPSSRRLAAELDPYRSGFRRYCCGQAYGAHMVVTPTDAAPRAISVLAALLEPLELLPHALRSPLGDLVVDGHL
jgi:hypothetical protein